MAGERLAKYISDQKEPDGKKTDIVFGEVVSTSPLRVRVENRFTIETDFLIVSQMARLLRIAIPAQTVQITGRTSEGDSLTGSGTVPEQSITIFEDLRVGDHVRMIKGQKSQLFYILERSG